MLVDIKRNIPRKDANHKALGITKIRGRQTLIWCGPLFIRVAR